MLTSKGQASKSLEQSGSLARKYEPAQVSDNKDEHSTESVVLCEPAKGDLPHSKVLETATKDQGRHGTEAAYCQPASPMLQRYLQARDRQESSASEFLHAAANHE